MATEPCPGNTGCRCRHCYGLPEFLEAHGLPTRGLPATRPPVTLHVVTPGPPDAIDLCDETMTCGCERCTGTRVARLTSPPRHVRQPWEPRAA